MSDGWGKALLHVRDLDDSCIRPRAVVLQALGASAIESALNLSGEKVFGNSLKNRSVYSGEASTSE